MINRIQVTPILIKKFTDDYNGVMKQYNKKQQIELTEHLLKVMELMETYQRTKDENIYKEWQQKEKALAEKYRQALSPYKAKSFYKYFEYDIILAEKGLYTPEEYNRLLGEEQCLSDKEINTFLSICIKGLKDSLEQLYLNSPLTKETESGKHTTANEEPLGDTPDEEITRSRQLLTIYYLLKADFNIEHRTTHSVSDIAKLIHLLTGTKFTSLTHSEIYKMYKRIPGHKRRAELLQDLKFIRPYFESLELKAALELIDSDIKRA